MNGEELAREAGKLLAPGETLDAVRDRASFLRRQRGWSYGDAAKRLGITRECYGRIESGLDPMTVGFLWALADLYGVPAGVLVAPVPEEGD